MATRRRDPDKASNRLEHRKVDSRGKLVHCSYCTGTWQLPFSKSDQTVADPVNDLK